MSNPDDIQPPKVTGSPERIWLVYGDIERDCTHFECCRDGEVTWCEDGQFSSDVQYVRADALTAQAATIAEQAAQIEAAIPAMREYARKNPKHYFSADGAEQDPNGAHAWLAQNDAAMQSGKAAEPDATKCRKCNGNMRPGTYLEQTFSGVPDFPGDTHAVTVSPSGPGRLAECLKCDACGHSVTAGKAVQV